jgi:hypothetical protein
LSRPFCCFLLPVLHGIERKFALETRVRSESEDPVEFQPGDRPVHRLLPVSFMASARTSLQEAALQNPPQSACACGRARSGIVPAIRVETQKTVILPQLRGLAAVPPWPTGRRR